MGKKNNVHIHLSDTHIIKEIEKSQENRSWSYTRDDRIRWHVRAGREHKRQSSSNNGRQREGAWNGGWSQCYYVDKRRDNINLQHIYPFVIVYDKNIQGPANVDCGLQYIVRDTVIHFFPSSHMYPSLFCCVAL